MLLSGNGCPDLFSDCRQSGSGLGSEREESLVQELREQKRPTGQDQARGFSGSMARSGGGLAEHSEMHRSLCSCSIKAPARTHGDGFQADGQVTLSADRRRGKNQTVAVGFMDGWLS